MKLLDGNVLIYAVNAQARQHAVCREWLEAALSGDEPLGFNWIALNGFLRISTHPKVFAPPLPVAEAIWHAEQWFTSPVSRLIEPTPEHWQTLKELLLAIGTGGNLTTDAHLAALAICHDATLVSCDTDFARFRGITWENPAAVP